jgi:hypothetical protein
LCGLEFSNGSQKANHIRWKHLKVTTTISRSTYICEFCKKEMYTTKAAFSSHVAKCKGNPNRTICKDTHNRRTCEFCGLENSTNVHRIYCEKNPNKKDGTWKGRHHSEETKKKLSEIGRSKKYRRIMRHTQEYKGVLYDSSWEVEFAKRLEELGIDFERPKIPIEYKDAENNTHNYFPDFYIPKINKFVEIKNPYLFNNDPKVQILKERVDIIWLTDLDSISKFEI